MTPTTNLPSVLFVGLVVLVVLAALGAIAAFRRGARGQSALLKDHPAHCTRNTSTRCSSSSTR